MRLHPNRNTRSDWLERQFFFFSGTRQSLPQQGFGDFQTAMPGEKDTGNWRGANRDTGRRSEPATIPGTDDQRPKV